MPKLSFKILILFLISTFAIGFYFFGSSREEICPTCDGTGREWTPFWGYLDCSRCDGSGKVYTASFFSLALIFFVIFVFGFLALFALAYFFSAFYLEANPWVRDVEEMEFLFNPMYFTWLFYVDRKKWVKWNTVISLVFMQLLLAVIAFYQNATQDTLAGWFIRAVLTVPFAVAWYQNFENLFDFLL